jgi:hypothetical protein
LNNSDPVKIYPSSLTFSWNTYYTPKYESGCWRYMQLAVGAKRIPLHPDYAAIGNMHEELHEKDHPEAKREVPFKRVVNPNTILSGRADFVFDDRVDECKATFSETTFKNAKAGKPEMSHLTQLVCYLMEFGVQRGRLIYGYFVQEKDKLDKPKTFRRKDTAIIEVSIGDQGNVYVGGADTGYTVSDLTNTIFQIADWMRTDLPAPRPAANGFMSACKFCPASELFDRIDDQNLLISEVRTEALELIENKKPAIPKPSKEK